MTDDKKAKWDRVRLEVQAQNVPDIQILALLQWAKEEGKTDEIFENEMKRRKKSGFWLNEEWDWIPGTSPYTEQEVKTCLDKLKTGK